MDGAPVSAELSRVNGCEISRWDALLPVLVEPGGVDDVHGHASPLQLRRRGATVGAVVARSGDDRHHPPPAVGLRRRAVGV